MKSKLGVVLFQLGGPDSPQAIEGFLYNLFSDPMIIDFPLAKLARRPLAHLIASRRAKHVAHHYAAIGGGSPIGKFTRWQAEALERELSGEFDVRVVIAMRYWNPFTGDAIRELMEFGAERVAILPLYPQYSRTTTGSSLAEWKRQLQLAGWDPPVHLVRDYHDDPAYIASVAGALDEQLARFPRPDAVHLVFCAHSVPVSNIKAGDPYQKQIERTMELVVRAGKWPNRSTLCYQSKVGPMEWLRPMMRETLEKLGQGQAEAVLMIPISFVSDHLETLYEIEIEHKEIAHQFGISHFRMVPGLNDAPSFIAALAGLVRKAVAPNLTAGLLQA